jgi:hypothetical protein
MRIGSVAHHLRAAVSNALEYEGKLADKSQEVDHDSSRSVFHMATTLVGKNRNPKAPMKGSLPRRIPHRCPPAFEE